jgi:hypothetical protein
MNTKLDTRNTQYPPFGEVSPSADAIRNAKNGFVLPLVVFGIVILMALIIGSAMTSYGSRLQAVQTKSQTEAMLAAEAGYEQAIFWMSQRTDLLGDIQDGNGQGSINFATGSCSYTIGFHGFIGVRPVFRVTSTGTCGRPSFTRVVDVDVMQETSGWAMGACRVPNGTTSTTEVYFKNGEIVDMPLHINKANDNPDYADIFINTSNGSPAFLRKVEMGESRKLPGGADKKIVDAPNHQNGTYASVMPLFKNGIDFDQPGIRITDQAAVTSKVTRFYNSTAAVYRFTPVAADINVSTPRYSAVQLEFYVLGGVGMVRITNNCTVKADSPGDYDYMVSGSGGNTFQKYNTYAYHFAPSTTNLYRNIIEVPVGNTYVTQTIGGYTSDPGGQIYVDGNVVIGGDSTTYPDQTVKGKITVVATGNIWIADSIKVDDNGGTQRDANGMPSADNPNVLGLIARGVIKVVNPTGTSVSPPTTRLVYQPIGITKSGCTGRLLPNPLVVEAAITVGGGGWGAEEVYNPGRREYSNDNCDGSGNHYDDLYVRGSITEIVRGVVGVFSDSTGQTIDGYSKHYYIDTRLMSGILPGDIWFSGKYIPAPAGWHDHSPNN